MKKFDFSGYVTKNDLLCTDGRTIRKDAFKHNDGQLVPLVWQHQHNDPTNILGHAQLTNVEDGVYAHCKFNDTDAAKQAKELVKHGDITSLSIYANQLKQQGANVLHGAIREVSLVLAGANPGAFIDNISFAHSDGTYNVDEHEALIYSGENFSIEEEKEMEHADMDNEQTVEEVFDTLTDIQKDVVYAMIGQVLSEEGEAAEHSAMGEFEMKHNVFEGDYESPQTVLSHSDFKDILGVAQKTGSFKDAFLEHAGTYGIDNIDVLFPDAKNVGEYPSLIKRDTDWVAGVLGGTHHSPFARIKTTHADITADEARARGYVTGALKKEEVVSMLKRVTIPTTIYKKQKLDRDDIIDITDLNVVAWIKMEMRMMLDEEIARAILIGDGRDAEDESKINEDHIRPIYKDVEMYAHRISIPQVTEVEGVIEAIIRSRKHYKGSGTPTFYTSTDMLTDMLLIKDKMGRRLYETEAALASALRVSRIVEIPAFEGVSNTVLTIKSNLVGIIVNLKDYTVGADKGGEINMFDDFDIDYNQYKYLLETRISGALKLPKSALIIEQLDAVA